jgi:hypothetical protein
LKLKRYGLCLHGVLADDRDDFDPYSGRVDNLILAEDHKTERRIPIRECVVYGNWGVRDGDKLFD